jgi:uncharacterized membrane protein YhdT
VRVAQVIGAAVLIVVGTVWTFQGYGTLKGSFMTGSPVWFWIGLACVAAGVVVLVLAFVGSRGSAPPRT